MTLAPRRSAKLELPDDSDGAFNTNHRRQTGSHQRNPQTDRAKPTHHALQPMTKKRFITLVAVILLIRTVGAMVPLQEAKAAGIPGGEVPTGVAGAGVTVCTALIYGGVISGGSSTVLGVGCYIGALALGGIASLAGSYFEKTAWMRSLQRLTFKTASWTS